MRYFKVVPILVLYNMHFSYFIINPFWKRDVFCVKCFWIITIYYSFQVELDVTLDYLHPFVSSASLYLHISSLIMASTDLLHMYTIHSHVITLQFIYALICLLPHNIRLLTWWSGNVFNRGKHTDLLFNTKV